MMMMMIITVLIIILIIIMVFFTDQNNKQCWRNERPNQSTFDIKPASCFVTITACLSDSKWNGDYNSWETWRKTKQPLKKEITRKHNKQFFLPLFCFDGVLQALLFVILLAEGKRTKQQSLKSLGIKKTDKNYLANFTYINSVNVQLPCFNWPLAIKVISARQKKFPIAKGVAILRTRVCTWVSD